MVRRSGWLGVAVVGLVLAGCGRLSLPWSPKPTPAPPPPVATDPVPAAVDVRTLLPSGSIEWLATFDDGTPNQTEAVLLTPEAVVGTQGGTPYVTWHLRPEGIFRKEPKSGAFLLYLPAELRDGQAWTQEAGGETHWFMLTKCTGEECWEVQVLTGNLLQTFTWAPGKWIIRAESLDRAVWKNTFHKVMKGEPVPSKQLAAPEVWVDGKVPPIVATEVQLFEAERQKRMPIRDGN